MPRHDVRRHASFPTVVSFHGNVTAWSKPNFPAKWTLYVGVDDVIQKLNIIIFTRLQCGTLWSTCTPTPNLHVAANSMQATRIHLISRFTQGRLLSSSPRRRGIWGWTVASPDKKIINNTHFSESATFLQRCKNINCIKQNTIALKLQLDGLIFFHTYFALLWTRSWVTIATELNRLCGRVWLQGCRT